MNLTDSSRIKRILLFLMLSPLVLFSAHAGDWVLSAREFEFSQNVQHSQAETSLCRTIPALILEQLDGGASRIPTQDELAARKYESLLEERQSLFLELSAAVKKRDSLVVQEPNARKLKSRIAEEEKKISAIQKKIQDNLDESEKYSGDAVEAPDGKEAEVMPGAEKVSVYRGDGFALFEPSPEVMKEGTASRRYEKAVIDAKINALVSGSITVYGNYLSVSADLTLYPGAKKLCSVMEVGSMDDIARISRSLARRILPVIVNTTGTALHFELDPAELSGTAKITVDGLPVQADSPVIVPAASHTVEVQCPGYISQSVTYLFQDSPHFVIHVPMRKKAEGMFSVSLREPSDGQLYFNSEPSGSALDGAEISINGRNIIGQLRLDEKDAFFMIPPSLQEDGNSLVVPSLPADLDAEIERRRIWSYRGYTALILTLPFTFYSLGHFNSAANAYMSATVSYEEVQKWNTLRWTSLGITVAAGGFFIYELIRYLRTADRAVPVNARKAKPGELEAINARAFEIKNEMNESSGEEQDEPAGEKE